ncbi:MAG TPA: hypothetical protein PJ991_05605 [Kiritimatiellia bacterium]|nr:hypothetical protein [Kiritimatiellia bacterium]
MLPILKGMTKGQISRGRKNNYVMPVAMLVLLFLIGQIFWLNSNRHMFAPFATTRIQCDTCARVGVVRDRSDGRKMTMCPACFGVGYHTVRSFDERDVLCAPCGGMGRLEEESEWRTCRRCQGRGIHRSDDWQIMVDVDEQGQAEERK